MPWPTKKLEAVCEIVKSGIASFVGEKEYIDTNSVQNFSIVKSQAISYTKRPSRANMEPKTNDVLVAKMADTVKVYLANSKDEKGRIFSTGFFVLRPENNLIIPKFLFFYCASNLFQILKDTLARGSTQKALNDEKLKKYFEIPLPPLKIQKRIVARIGELFEKIDKAKELRQKAQEETSQILFLALEQIFGRADKKWKLKKLGDITEIINGLVIKQSSENKSGYPISRIETPQNFEVDPRRVRYVEVSKELFHKYKYKTGDILFSHINSFELVGKVAIYRGFPKDLIHGMNLLRIRVKNKDICNPSFIFFYFVTKEFRSKIEPYIRRAVNQASLNQTNLKSIEIPLPPLSEQKKIVAELDTLREKVEKLKKYQEEQLKNLEELKKSILEKFLKGELVK